MSRKARYGLGAAILAVFCVMFLYWASGFNFDERGTLAVTCAFFSIVAACFVGALAYDITK